MVGVTFIYVGGIVSGVGLVYTALVEPLNGLVIMGIGGTMVAVGVTSPNILKGFDKKNGWEISVVSN